MHIPANFTPKRNENMTGAERSAIDYKIMQISYPQLDVYSRFVTIYRMNWELA